ncbi:MAG TPA: sugar ABC transporter ATP-binding protein, partial [Erysipelotrichaceae bacterium]|nr:sugar ABC transporter ATP-binding protein [Erysipelotrichaceae bacterium]
HIDVYETLGAEVYLYFNIKDTKITARVDPHTTSRQGDTVKFALDLSNYHLFDKDTELAI